MVSGFGKPLSIAVILVAAAAAFGAEGTLLIAGGGRLPDAVTGRFVELAGGPDARLVVIPTASSAEPQIADIEARWVERGCGSVTVLHTRDRSVADSEPFVRPLRRASAVWISGGKQRLLAEAYVGTAVERELRSLVRRGGVVGGTSAGAAIQSRVMIQSGNPEPRLATGFDLASGVIVDQHFLARDRMNRLLAAVRQHPACVGVGIDEGTAIELRGQTAMVLGDSYVTVITIAGNDSPAQIKVRSAGDSFHLP